MTLVVTLSVSCELEEAAASSAFACRACRFIDAVLLDAEDISGGQLCAFLEEKCAMLGLIYSECKALVDSVVEQVEYYGHLLDQDKLCTELIKVC
ncbi:hypothetical protein QR680_011411 [Steinernema hermaphroditum]|uniref:Saposin B-type domain-containing protein n=1 Tax=Steinernema hermaphroditum TaxID=289476 RepID=A0AA39MD77_9BILA|nr:hypothetical protein QR680_011411 [Steinernema hermaphroditum]